MRLIHLLLILVFAICLCLGGSASLAAEAGKDKNEQPSVQFAEPDNTKAEKPKEQQDHMQPQPANVPVIKQDEGC